jgi:predicted methyltransferase
VPVTCNGALLFGPILVRNRDLVRHEGAECLGNGRSSTKRVARMSGVDRADRRLPPSGHPILPRVDGDMQRSRYPYVLSSMHAQPLLVAAKHGEESAQISLDLGLSISPVAIGADLVTLPDGQTLAFAAIAEIAASERSCFEVVDGRSRKIHRFSEEFSRAYSLMATERAPTLINAGFTMHRIVGTDPHEDTLRKIRSIGRIAGRVLDTTTGLGYTAIEAAKAADCVVTVELDPVVLEIARLNPWSRALFEGATITQLVGDSCEVIETFDEGSFALIIHDPPSFSLAGELYSGEFYRRAFRVLRRGGRLFHYVGNLDSKHGSRIAAGVTRRLAEAGFTRIEKKGDAFALIAQK